jgi:hypothetical protein
MKKPFVLCDSAGESLSQTSFSPRTSLLSYKSASNQLGRDCLGGANAEEDYWQTVRQAGFTEIQRVPLQ